MFNVLLQCRTVRLAETQHDTGAVNKVAGLIK